MSRTRSSRTSSGTRLRSHRRTDAMSRGAAGRASTSTSCSRPPSGGPPGCIRLLDADGDVRVLGDTDPGLGETLRGVLRGGRPPGGRVAAGRHHRVHDGVRVDVHEVEALGTVVAALAPGRNVEVLGVARRGGHGNGDVGERRGRGVVQVPGEDGAHVGVAQHLGEAGLVAQFDEHGLVEHAGHRRVMHGEDGAEGRRRLEFLRQPVQLFLRDLAVVEAGHRGVEGDDAQAVDVVDAVDRAGGRRLIEQQFPEGGAVVVVAHGPHDLRAERLRDGFDETAQLRIGVRLAAIGEVAGEHERIGLHPGGADVGEDLLHPGVGVDRSVEQLVAADEVGVGDVQQGVRRPRVFGYSLGPTRAAHDLSLPFADVLRGTRRV
ncbi:hypothetical protein RHRU231_960016 [Rhodococcus ruber]|uniref:Uncharacterized protein n=1 Tax=Rhodococcus ruber TaxID=1830 RepID=A0A098BWA7_9NOCA|nr:hypothetical protein RHRU231_960016 [Rhodococcus ruber]